MPPQAVLATLAALWAVLDELESKVAIAGGLALSFWGHPRSTRDVDLTLMTDTLKKLEAQLTRSGFVAQAPSRPLGPFDFVQYKFEPFESFVEVEVDILAGKDEYFRQAVRRAVAANIEGLSSPIRVLTREDLIIYKLLANRLIDQADILSLMEMHWDELDRDYLKLWANQFDLSTEYDTAVQRYRELNP